MHDFQIYEIKQSVFENNDREAELLRQEMKKDTVFLLNLISLTVSFCLVMLAQRKSKA